MLNSQCPIVSPITYMATANKNIVKNMLKIFCVLSSTEPVKKNFKK